ncbi:hypothetical protein APHNYW_1616 [Anaplasma phagocytophilum str. ApNYW]|nr:hypothetical protein APHNYW_1616 [Anaplasma phagocytophilum str. ApNYW]
MCQSCSPEYASYVQSIEPNFTSFAAIAEPIRIPKFHTMPSTNCGYEKSLHQWIKYNAAKQIMLRYRDNLCKQ